MVLLEILQRDILEAVGIEMVVVVEVVVIAYFGQLVVREMTVVVIVACFGQVFVVRAVVVRGVVVGAP